MNGISSRKPPSNYFEELLRHLLRHTMPSNFYLTNFMNIHAWGVKSKNTWCRKTVQVVFWKAARGQTRISQLRLNSLLKWRQLYIFKVFDTSEPILTNYVDGKVLGTH